MAKSFGYVDGFVLAVKKKRLNEYKKMAQLAAKVWLEHGAIDYVECAADDVKRGKVTSFPQSVQLKAGEVVFFSWITYKSKTHRDRVLKKVKADERFKVFENAEMPFDMQRMIYGGFKPIVQHS